MDRVIAHEIAHLFGALDEYSDASHGQMCSRNTLGGILQVSNANCIEGNTPAAPTVACLMLANQPVFCSSTPFHVGWEDRDGNQAMDLAGPPQITGLTAPFPSTQPRVVQVDGPGPASRPG